MDEKRKYIDNFERKFTNHWIVNRRIEPGYTYKDLDRLLIDICSKQANSFKVNIGLGFVLYNIQTGEYRYHYVSSNNLLFDKAISVTNSQDVERFIKKVCDLDLQTNAYLKKPSSSWILAGITNIEIWIFQMKDIPIGWILIDKIFTRIPNATADKKEIWNDLRTTGLITDEQYDKLSIGPHTLPSISRIIQGKGLYLNRKWVIMSYIVFKQKINYIIHVSISI